MPDDAQPIVTTVPETVTVDTGADSKTLGDLNKQFGDFWAEEDAKSGQPPAEAPPPAPEGGAGQETKPEKQPEPPATKPQPPKQAAPTAPAVEQKPPPQDKRFTDEEVEKLALPPRAGQPPEMQADFKQLKGFWQADRQRLKALEAQHAQLQAELAQAKQNAFTPEQKADYEHAASVRRRFDFVSDPEFQQRYQGPIANQFQAVLQEAINVLPDRGSAQQWAQHILQNYSPDQLNKQWWLNSVIAKVPNELERQALMGSVSELLKLQRDRDTEITRRTNDKSSFDNWMTEKTNATAERVKSEIMSEIGEQEKHIQDVLPRDPEAAKTAEERAAIETHNERFQRLNGHFLERMQDLSKNGPRAWVRASVAATRGLYLEEQYNQVAEELRLTKAERDQLRTELDKIAGVRRKMAASTGTPHTPAPAKNAPLNNGLSIKDLDVRKSFQTFWGEVDRGNQ
jgi:pyruvate/2-oxoglutarate dehydrogenase complex dihydrolipoamide acyltransferase (E2) component